MVWELGCPAAPLPATSPKSAFFASAFVGPSVMASTCGLSLCASISRVHLLAGFAGQSPWMTSLQIVWPHKGKTGQKSVWAPFLGMPVLLSFRGGGLMLDHFPSLSVRLVKRSWALMGIANQ